MSLFGDIFDTEEEILSGEAGGNTLSHWERLPKNCAHNLPMPDLARKIGYPIGLKNQGATCYLNSLFQILFHTPQFRQLMISLPLCNNSVQQSTTFVDSKTKHSFLLGFQRLFSQMSLCDMRAVGTDYLNKSFGWQKNQNKQQQDIQQAMRIIFDVIQRALFGTQYEQAIKSFFKGSTIRYKTCKNCGQSTEHVQLFYDIQLYVKNIPSIEQSIIGLTTPESMDGDNQIYCELCQSKQDMWLGNRLNQLPNTLIFSLKRFDFDYDKMDRVKLNSEFQFHLELDLSTFLMQSPQLTKSQYQLYGILIHRGSAQGGHYISYVRDILKQSDWNNGLKQAKQQQQKIKSQSINKKQDNNEDQKKQKTTQKTFKLRQPVNKSLEQNWFEMNDNIATAIDKEKIAKQFQGSQCAYILFYRRKGLSAQHINLQIPKYFAQGIIEANEALKKQRQLYQIQKNHIMLNINNENFKLAIDLRIENFISQFVPLGYALVQQSTHNQLPYYPMQFVNSQNYKYKVQSSLKSQEIVHESIWKTYELNSTYYENIKNMIGKNRLPMQIIILDGQAPKRIVCFNDENFLMLRIRLEKLLNLPYQSQVITLVTPYKQSILTDNPQNDEILLPKLGVIHSGQLIVKSLGNQEAQKGQKIQQKLTLCFLVERDDVIGLKRIYFQKSKTLNELLIYCNLSQNSNFQVKRRFRNMGTNRLYYNSHYEKALQQLQFTEEMIKLRLQRGQIPIKGDVCIKIKLQSQLCKKNQQQSFDNIEKIFDPNIVISDVKQWACTYYKLDPSLHKLYLTDWTGEPIRSLTREKQTLFEANFGRQQLICLRDIHSPIGTQLVHLQMFSTKTGSPDNIEKQSTHIKIQEFKTIQQLKQLMISTIPELANIQPQRLRLREIKRDYMFGTIWRQTKKSIKSVTINSNKAVYQVLESPEQLREDQIVLILKKRNQQKRLYQGSIELIFNAGKNPTVQDLHASIKAKIQEQSNIKTIKYVNYDFQWIEVSRENIQKLIKKKKTGKNQQPKKQQPKKSDKNKKDNEKKDQFKKKDKNKLIVLNAQNAQDSKTQATKQQKANQQKPKETRPKKQPKEKTANNTNKSSQQHLNLRRAPILLKDGDWIGYGKADDLVNDDLQTDQDLTFRLIKEQKGTIAYKRDQAGGFKINVDF